MSTDYIINFTSSTDTPVGKVGFSIKPNTTNGPTNPHSTTPHTNAVSANTSLVLPGKGIVNYGPIIAQNLVHLLENFAATTAPTYPTVGQLWFDTSSGVLKIYKAANTWASLQTAVGTQAPASPAVGSMWFNTTTTSLVWWTGSMWVGIADSLVDYVPLAGGTMTGNLTFGGTSRITNLPVPLAATEPATKAYADAIRTDLTASKANTSHAHTITQVTGLPAALDAKLPITGGSITGNLAVSGNLSLGASSNIILPLAPTAPTHAVNKQYVDGLVAGTSITVSLPSLTDVTLTAPYDNNILFYSSTSTQWVNSTLSDAGIAPASHLLDTTAHPASAVTYVAPDGFSSTDIQGMCDELATAFVPLDGGNMTGMLHMGTSRIAGLSNPVAVDDATTKQYVDVLNTTRELSASVTASTTHQTPPYRYGMRDLSVFLNGARMLPSTHASHQVNVARTITGELTATGLPGTNALYTGSVDVTTQLELVSAAPSTITVAGDWYDAFVLASSMSIVDSSANDGTYPITGVAYATGVTTVTTSGTLPSTATDGFVVVQSVHPLVLRGILNTTYGDLITSVNSGIIEEVTDTTTGTNTFTVVGDFTTYFLPGRKVTVMSTDTNDGVYTVVSATYSSSSTTVYVAEPIATSGETGYVVGPVPKTFTLSTSGRNLHVETTTVGSHTSVTIASYGSLHLWENLGSFVGFGSSFGGMVGGYREVLDDVYTSTTGDVVGNSIRFSAPATGTIYITSRTSPL